MGGKMKGSPQGEVKTIIPGLIGKARGTTNKNQSHRHLTDSLK
jgi:hypothetical protein